MLDTRRPRHNRPKPSCPRRGACRGEPDFPIRPAQTVPKFTVTSPRVHPSFTRHSDPLVMIPAKTVLRIILLSTAPLLVPLTGMQLSAEWNWSGRDFLTAWVLLSAAGFFYTFLNQPRAGPAARLASVLVVATSLLLVWLNLAVGVVGSEGNPANPLYAAVIGTGIAGAIIARFRPRGMAWTAFAMAAVQTMVPLIALKLHQPDFHPGLAQVLLLNLAFTTLFAIAGLLFLHTARNQPERRTAE